MLTPFSLASGMMIWPAVTRVSLFARAISFPALIAAIVGSTPIIPTIAVTTMSASGTVAASMRPSSPYTILTPEISLNLSLISAASFSSPTDIRPGMNSLTCFSRSSMFLPQERATTSISLFALTISRVWVPMEPVDPMIDIFFIMFS